MTNGDIPGSVQYRISFIVGQRVVAERSEVYSPTAMYDGLAVSGVDRVRADVVAMLSRMPPEQFATFLSDRREHGRLCPRLEIVVDLFNPPPRNP